MDNVDERIAKYADHVGATNVSSVSKVEFDRLKAEGLFAHGPWRQFEGTAYGSDKAAEPLIEDPKAYGMLKDRTVVYCERTIAAEKLAQSPAFYVSEESFENLREGKLGGDEMRNLWLMEANGSPAEGYIEIRIVANNIHVKKSEEKA